MAIDLGTSRTTTRIALPAASRDWPWSGIQRDALLVLTGVIGLFAVAILWATYWGFLPRGLVGYDAALYVSFGQRWLETGQLYSQAQLAGPYLPFGAVNLYPPIALYLFVPFIWLPRILWWAIPLAIIGATLWRYRPATWSWPIFAAIACTQPFGAMIVAGNSNLWVIAATCLALRWPAAAGLLVFKPSVLPLALPFARSRAWWIGMAIAGALWLPLADYVGPWLTASRNMIGIPALYSLNAIPILCIPFLARAASTRYPLTVSRGAFRAFRLSREMLTGADSGLESVSRRVGSR